MQSDINAVTQSLSSPDKAGETRPIAPQDMRFSIWGEGVDIADRVKEQFLQVNH